MGLTPLEGLVMGTRCGDIDPAIHFYLCREAGVNVEQVESLLNKGVDKFIAFEVPVSTVHRLYGVPFEVVAADIEDGSDMRVLDYNGPHIFSSFHFDELGAPTLHEADISL